MADASLAAQLSDLRKLIPQAEEELAQEQLLATLFACTDAIVSTIGGATPEKVFERVNLPVPSRASVAAVPDFVANSFTESDFGSIYQLFREPHRFACQRRFEQPNKSVELEDLIAFTQLYTPDWVVDFLIDETMPNTKRAEIDVLDPACGAGHFLLRAVNRIFAARSTFEDAPSAMRNAMTKVYGCDIDATGLAVAHLVLILNALRHMPLDLIPLANLSLVLDCPETPLGTLSRSWPCDHLLARSFDAIIGNPPYLGRKLLHRTLKAKLKRDYPNSHSDLCAAFVERGLELLKPGGRLGFITQSSVLYLPTYQKLREEILAKHQICSLVDAGPHLFPLQTGEKVSSVLLVVQRGQQVGAHSKFLSLIEHKNKQEALGQAIDGDRFLCLDQNSFRAFRGSAFNFACPAALIVTKERAECLLGDGIAEIKQGLATTDNARFVRWWWQVPPQEIGKVWFPYVKGSGGERWYAPALSVVNWRNGGEEIKDAVAKSYPYLNGKTEWVVKNEQFYFREGLTFSFVSSKALAVRWLPPGCIFDVGGSALFADAKNMPFLLAYLNSSFIAAFAKLLNPTINFQVGDLKQLPYFSIDQPARERLSWLAQECIELKQRLVSFQDNSWCTGPPPDLLQVEPPALLTTVIRLKEQILNYEAEIDQTVIEQIAKSASLDRSGQDELARVCSGILAARKAPEVPFSEPADLAFAVISAALLSRHKGLHWTGDDMRQCLQVSDDRIQWLEQAVRQPLAQYLATTFVTRHSRTHKRAPRLQVRLMGSRLEVEPSGNN